MSVRKDIRARLTKEEWKRTDAYRERQELIYKVITGTIIAVGFLTAIWLPCLAAHIAEIIFGI